MPKEKQCATPLRHVHSCGPVSRISDKAHIFSYAWNHFAAVSQADESA
jgi:hypothetical protein